MKKVKILSRSLWHLKRKSLFKTPNINIVKKAKWACHYCGRYGHLKPYCYRLHGYPETTSKAPIRKARKSTKKAWRVKGMESAQIAHTSLKVSSKEDWYFDSGCSRH